MIYRAAAALFAVLAVLAAGFLFRSAPSPPAERPSRNGALLPEVELTEPAAAPILLEEPGHGQPAAIADVSEPVPAPLLQDSTAPYQDVPPTAFRLDESEIDRGRNRAQPNQPAESRPLNAETSAD